MGLSELQETIRRQMTPDNPGRPLVGLDEFFNGNDDLGSIGCNLVPHPGLDVFYGVLSGVRNRVDVQDVFVGISELMPGSEWPFSDCVYVVTSASAEEVARWFAPLMPDPLEDAGWFPAEPVPAPPVLRGNRAYTIWWD